MKKMYIVIALMIAMCITFCGCFSTPDSDTSQTNNVQTENNPDYTLYKPYMQEVLDNLPDEDYAGAFGVLYDVDQNGVDELIMLFESDDVRHPNSLTRGMAAAYSIYTIYDGKVVELEDEHFLFPFVGGPDGEVFVLDDNEQIYLAFRYTELNPSEYDDLECLGNMYIYTLDGKELELVKDCEYTYYYTYYVGDINEDVVDYSRSKLVINNKECDHEEFDSWLKSCTQTKILSYSFSSDEYDLETLVNTL